MNTSVRKALALVLALVMLLSCCPGLSIAGFATGDNAETALEGQPVPYEKRDRTGHREPAPLLDVPFENEEALPAESIPEISQEEFQIEAPTDRDVSISAGKLTVTSGNSGISAAEIEAALGAELPVLTASEAAAAKDAARAMIGDRFCLSPEKISAAKEIYDSWTSSMSRWISSLSLRNRSSFPQKNGQRLLISSSTATLQVRPSRPRSLRLSWAFQLQGFQK